MNMTSNSPIYSLAVLDNGLVASSAGLNENKVRIWNVTNRALVRTLSGQTNYIFSMAALKNGYLACAGADN